MNSNDQGPGQRHARRRALGAGLGLGVAGILGGHRLPALAQTWPNRAVKVIVPVPPGAGPDVDMREIALKASGPLGQSIVIENRPGAATRIATEAGVRSAPDGYTFLMSTPAMVLNPLIRTKMAYNYERDLVPVSLLYTAGYALVVGAASPARSLEQFIQQAKAAPGQTTFATLGAGSTSHLTAAWLCDVTGIDAKFVHYQTSAPYNDVSTGQVSAVFESVNPLSGFIKAGKLRPLAISQPTRHPQYPDVPTFKDAGLAQFTPTVWVGLVAPAGTPQPIIDRFGAALTDVIRSPEYLRSSEEVSRIPAGSTPDEFRAFLERERAQWTPVVKKLGLELE